MYTWTWSGVHMKRTAITLTSTQYGWYAWPHWAQGINFPSWPCPTDPQRMHKSYEVATESFAEHTIMTLPFSALPSSSSTLFNGPFKKYHIESSEWGMKMTGTEAWFSLTGSKGRFQLPLTKCPVSQICLWSPVELSSPSSLTGHLCSS